MNESSCYVNIQNLIWCCSDQGKWNITFITLACKWHFLWICASGMNTGISVLVLLVALSSSGCFSHPTHLVEEAQSDGGPVDEHTCHTRAVPPSGHLNVLFKTQEKNVEEDTVRRLNELLARLISRKGKVVSFPFLHSPFIFINILMIVMLWELN